MERPARTLARLPYSANSHDTEPARDWRSQSRRPVVGQCLALFVADNLERELAGLRAATESEVRDIRASTATEIKRARDSADRHISAARDDAVR
jgi:hypothetical protein